ncbi:GNAT family N-acetyltransferase [Kribbella sp. GL6]|uniref:GNAT family N-acetyltransferase n=1 Tax=Kribbella sp. GL6 TaxID=3419765 RepID=UPI003D023BB0
MDEPVPPVVQPGRMTRHEQPILELGNGLDLRPWELGDAGALVAAGDDPSIQQWNLLFVPSKAEAQQRILRMHTRWRAETAAIWAIARQGEAIGLIGWQHIDLAQGSAEIAYWVLPTARGGGIVTAAVERVTRWAFDDLGLHRLELCHSIANPASCRVAEKTGYTFEATLRSALLHTDGWHDQHLHARIAP